MEEGYRQYFAQSAGEYGTTTGRARRMGWLDCPRLRYSLQAERLYRLADYPHGQFRNASHGENLP